MHIQHHGYQLDALLNRRLSVEIAIYCVKYGLDVGECWQITKVFLRTEAQSPAASFRPSVLQTQQLLPVIDAKETVLLVEEDVGNFPESIPSERQVATLFRAEKR